MSKKVKVISKKYIQAEGVVNLESFKNKYRYVVDEGCVLSGYLTSCKLTIFATYKHDGTSIANYVIQCELDSGTSSVKTFENWERLVIFVKNLVTI